jgi:hypothetical protein
MLKMLAGGRRGCIYSMIAVIGGGGDGDGEGVGCHADCGGLRGWNNTNYSFMGY